jgi:hypothetical protein
MRCPRCRHRAIGLLRWYGHSLWQPRQKDRRWQLPCRSCNATLYPSDRDHYVRIGLSAVVTFGSLVVTSQWADNYRPYAIVNILFGLLLGVLLHYPIAKYDCIDSLDEAPLPQARTRDKQSK